MRNFEKWKKAMTIHETIFPKGCYYFNGNVTEPNCKTPYHIISRELKNKHLSYFQMMDQFIQTQELTSDRRGADLPYIGERYFECDKGVRVMMITQDSDAPRAGSIVFLGPLLPEDYTMDEYRPIKRKMYDFLTPWQFHSGSYRHAVEIFKEWGIDLSFLYLTDARKVHLPGKDEYDENLSLDIMEKEIEAVAPEILVPAGDVAFNFLRSFTDRTISTSVGDVGFFIKDIPVVRVPFFIGRARRKSNEIAFNQKSERTKKTLEELLITIS